MEHGMNDVISFGATLNLEKIWICAISPLITCRITFCALRGGRKILVVWQKGDSCFSFVVSEICQDSGVYIPINGRSQQRAWWLSLMGLVLGMGLARILSLYKHQVLHNKGPSSSCFALFLTLTPCWPLLIHFALSSHYTSVLASRKLIIKR